jgi:hypothetical protein
MFRQNYYTLILVCWCSLSSGCVAYMEHQAASSQTGDPSAGGYFGYNQNKADVRLASMQAQRDSARQAARGTAREMTILQAQYADVQQQLKFVNDNAMKEALENETQQIKQAIVIATSN